MFAAAAASAPCTAPPDVDSVKVIQRFRKITSAALAGAAASAALPPQSSSGGARSVNTPCAGAWSLQTVQVTDLSLQNIHCKNIQIGVQRQAALQPPCSVVSTIADRLAEVLLEEPFTSPELEAFWCALMGHPLEPLPRSKPQIVEAFASFAKAQSSCGQHQDAIQVATVNNIIFSASSSTKCQDLNIALNSCSSNVVCILNGVAKAQTKVVPKSYQPEGGGGNALTSLPLWAVVLLIMGAVLVLGGLVAMAVRHNAAKRRAAELADLGPVPLEGSVAALLK